MHAARKVFDKVCLQVIRDTFFANRWSVIAGGVSGLSFLVQQNGKVPSFGLEWRPPKCTPLVGHLDLHIKKTLRSIFGLLTVMILKKVSEILLFQRNKFTACKVNPTRPGRA